MQNADEDSPSATVTYDHNYATYTIADPQYNSSGVQTGTTNRVVPIVKRTVAYKPDVKAIYDKNLAVSGRLNDFALTQANTLNTILGVPFTIASIDAVAPHASVPTSQILQTTIGTRGAIQSTVGSPDTLAHYDLVRAAYLTRPKIRFDIDRASRVVALRNSGVVPGMQSYDNEMRVFDFRWNDEENQATVSAGAEQTRLFGIELMKANFVNSAQAQDASQLIMFMSTVNQAQLQRFEMLRTISDFIETYRARSMQEIIATRAVSMNELSALLHGGQVAQPQFEGFRPGKLENTPVGQYVYQSAALDMQKYQTQVQQSNQMTGGILGLAGNVLGAAITMSDSRLKTAIRYVGSQHNGQRWYTWRYLWDAVGVCRFGVMAQEVLKITPWAVVQLRSGWLAVDYRKI